MRKTTILGLISVALFVAAIFLPMFSFSTPEETKIFSLWSSGDYGIDKSVAYMLLVIIGIMGLFALLASKKHMASIGTFIFAGLLLAFSINWIHDAIYMSKHLYADTDFNISYNIGIFVFVIGALAGLTSSVLGFMKK